MTKTLHFHLGPVQSYISSARRTRDIWAGSFLLSWLSAKAAAAALDGRPVTEDNLRSPRSASKDVTLQAACDSRENQTSSTNPFVGTFPNHFEVVDADSADEKNAIAEVRQCWVRLGKAVEAMIFDKQIDGAFLRDKYQDAREIFRQQIGDETATPFWEIYSIVVDEAEWKKKFSDQNYPDGEEPSPLAAAKTTRWTEDMAALPTVEPGAFCSMLSGWREISGVFNLKNKSDRDRRDAFWTDVRKAIVLHRYGRLGDGNREFQCLDIRANERLSAPALVKRLFPLINATKLQKIIGWLPIHRSVALRHYIEEVSADKVPTNKFGDIIREWFRGHSAPTRTEYLEQESNNTFAGFQSYDLWPSTSAVSAAHWIEKVQNYYPEEARSLAKIIGKLGGHIALAELNLFLPCLHDTNPTTLAFVDGAHLFLPTIEKGKKGSIGDDRSKDIYLAIESKLNHIASLTYGHGSRNLGRPAPVYAVVRADGDHMGTYANKYDEVSEVLHSFVTKLTGGYDNSLGTIISHNGTTLYASADEMIAICPIEDALDLACAVRNAFLEAVKKTVDSAPDSVFAREIAEKLTISVAVTYAHRQIPLSWVLESGGSLLNNIAKKAIGRNGLAIEVIDQGGRRFDWAAAWSDGDDKKDPIGDLMQIVSYAVGEVRQIGQNRFLHDLARLLEPFLFDIGESDVTKRLSASIELSKNEPMNAATPTSEQHEEMCRSLIGYVVNEILDGAPVNAEIKNNIKGMVCNISLTYGFDKENSRYKRYSKPISLNGLMLIRFVAENWRKEIVNTVNIAGAG